MNKCEGKKVISGLVFVAAFAWINLSLAQYGPEVAQTSAALDNTAYDFFPTGFEPRTGDSVRGGSAMRSFVITGGNTSSQIAVFVPGNKTVRFSWKMIGARAPVQFYFQSYGAFGRNPIHKTLSRNTDWKTEYVYLPADTESANWIFDPYPEISPNALVYLDNVQILDGNQVPDPPRPPQQTNPEAAISAVTSLLLGEEELAVDLASMVGRWKFTDIIRLPDQTFRFDWFYRFPTDERRMTTIFGVEVEAIDGFSYFPDGNDVGLDLEPVVLGFSEETQNFYLLEEGNADGEFDKIFVFKKPGANQATDCSFLVERPNSQSLDGEFCGEFVKSKIR